MPVNEHDNPYVVPHRQTYKSQYVRLPFQQLQAFADKRQRSFDAAEMAEDAMRNKLLQVQALRKDTKLRNQLIGNYEDEMIKNIEATGGDYAMAIPKIKAMGKRLHQDLTRGQLGAISGNHASAMAYNKALKEKYDKGDIDLKQLNGLQEISMYNYQGVQEQLQDNGLYNSFSGVEAANLVDIDKKVDDAVKGYMADKFNTSQYHSTPDGRYRYKTEDGWKTVKASDVYRDIEGMLYNDTEVMSYLNQEVQIDGFHANQRGEQYDMNSHLKSKLHQYASRAASKAGFREDWHLQDDYKADEYYLADFKAGLKFNYENIMDDFQYQSEVILQDNPLTHAKDVNGDELTGLKGIQQNITNWNKQGAASLKKLVQGLRDKSRTLSGDEFKSAEAAINKLEATLNGPNGYIEAAKMLDNPDRMEELGFMGVDDPTLSKAVQELKGFMQNTADAKQLLRQAEDEYMKKTGFDPQRYHNVGKDAVLRKFKEYKDQGVFNGTISLDLRNALKEEGVKFGVGSLSDQDVMDIVMPELSSDGQGNGWEVVTDKKATKSLNLYHPQFNPTGGNRPQMEEGITWAHNKRTNEWIAIADKGEKKWNQEIRNQYDSANPEAARKAHRNYEGWVTNYLNSEDVNKWKTGGGAVTSMMPGYKLGPGGQWIYDETQAKKNTLEARKYFRDNDGGLNYPHWQGLRGAVMTEDGTQSGNIMELLADKLGFDYESDGMWAADDKNKNILEQLKTSYPHLSQGATLMDRGQNRRFFEMKVNYNGREATVKVPIGTDNITSSSINNMVNNPASQIRTRYWDLKSKGLDRQRWDENPNVIFNTQDNTVTMPNRNMNVQGHPDYGRSTITMDFDSALPYLTEFKAVKDAGGLNKDVARNLHDTYWNSNLTPKNEQSRREKDLSFHSIGEARRNMGLNPNTVQMKTIYFIDDPQGGEPVRMTGRQIIEETENGNLGENDLAIKKNEFVQYWTNQGIPEDRARAMANERYGRSDGLHSLEDLYRMEEQNPNMIDEQENWLTN